MDKTTNLSTKAETLPPIKLSIDADGKITLPKQLLGQMGVATGSIQGN